MALIAAALRWAGIVIYRLGLHPVVIRLRARRVRILMYHACDEVESDFTAGLLSTTTPAQFAAHLAFYERHYQVIPLQRLEAGEIPERAAVITFDDGYRSVRLHAAPLLEQHRMPATVYLVTSVVGNQQLVWVNAMNALLRRYPDAARPVLAGLTGLAASAPPGAILDAVQNTAGPPAIAAALETIHRAAGVTPAQLAAEAALYVTWDDVRAMERQGISCGNHTSTHPSLTRLPLEAQRWEIAEAARTLVANGCTARCLAYPFGDHNADSRVAAIAEGCTSVMEVGLRTGPLDVHRLGRIPVDGMADAAELFACIEVVEPAKAWLRHLGRAPS